MSANGGPEKEHSSTELLEVERMTNALSSEWLEQQAVLPLRRDNGRLAVGTWVDHVDPLALDDLRLLFGAEIELERFGEHDLRGAIRRLYTQDATTAEGLIAGLSGEARTPGTEEIPLDDLLHLANEAPVVRLVNLLWASTKPLNTTLPNLEACSDPTGSGP